MNDGKVVLACEGNSEVELQVQLELGFEKSFYVCYNFEEVACHWLFFLSSSERLNHAVVM